jgi:hypothetical protein
MRQNINFIASHYKVNKGHISKITNLNSNKIYIGSTTRYDVNKRFEEHKMTNDGSALHNDMQLHDNWKIEIIDTIEYIDVQQLEIAETCYMIEYDSIRNGYNSKFSFSLDNI